MIYSGFCETAPENLSVFAFAQTGVGALRLGSCPQLT
jgi:hypothetical protein